MPEVGKELLASDDVTMAKFYRIPEVSTTTSDLDGGHNKGGIRIFKALARLASNSKFLLAKSEKNSPKSCLC
jgi:hypothetical protein